MERLSKLQRDKNGKVEQAAETGERSRKGQEQQQGAGQDIVKERDRDRDRNGNRNKDTNKDNARTLIEEYKKGKMEEHICFQRESH